MPNIRTDIRLAELRRSGQTFAQIASTENLPISTVRHAIRRGNVALGIAQPAPTRRTTASRASLIVSNFAGYEISDRFTFGVEIECVGLNTSEAARALRNAGIDCSDNGYTHAVLPTWKVVYDGSLRSRNGSCEVVSPVLRGRDGLKEIANVEKILKNAGATINRSCGQHIHIGVDGIVSSNVQAEIISQHARWQSAFDTLVPLSRFGNTYCQPRRVEVAERRATTWAQGVTAESGRYYTLNLSSFAKYGTFEFRQFAGCLNGQRIASWIALHIAFIQRIEHEILSNDLVLCAVSNEDIEANIDNTQPRNRRGVAVFNALMEILAPTMDADAVTYLRARSGNVGANESNRATAI